MEHSHHTTTDAAVHHDSKAVVKKIIRTTIILSVITIVELGLGFLMYFTQFPDWVNLFIKGMMVILTLAKAFYIVAIFMHLGDEIRNLIMTIVVPLMLFIWFIAAFLWDGASYRNLRNTYDLHYRETTLDRDARDADTTRDPLR
jgi:cytochrome c oxidase subunit IV